MAALLPTNFIFDVSLSPSSPSDNKILRQVRQEVENVMNSRLEALQQALSDAKEQASRVPGLMRSLSEKEDACRALQAAVDKGEVAKVHADQACADLQQRVWQCEDARVRAVQEHCTWKAQVERQVEEERQRVEHERLWLTQDREAVSMREAEMAVRRAECDAKVASAVENTRTIAEQADSLRCELVHREAAVQFAAEQVCPCHVCTYCIIMRATLLTPSLSLPLSHTRGGSASVW